MPFVYKCHWDLSHPSAEQLVGFLEMALAEKLSEQHGLSLFLKQLS